MPKPSSKKQTDPSKLEFEPNAWERFEALVRSAAKMGHLPYRPNQDRVNKTKPKTKR
jgi:hypothetical protein